ncbi:formylglycine-generating enzyme family protein [Flavobacterium sp. NRK F10]|uniref:formylglycine-generating enzyme family protein n=1 Tax=Flavobacterium sp. NRK F10 TaxID=2954931 RepID=UPI002090FD3B|nr:SUMF1/EgtB/PvdO family nonheme iron enzyme [Flavobacterium sp. NRK F10]MCO6175551.1 formylglycine-generating enzyme family protein [Flavobacterium sp. NRK F10]
MNKNYKFALLLIILFPFLNTLQAQYKPEMVTVKGGTFMMGTKENPYIETDEQLAHEVTVKDFEIGKYEVTIYEWSLYVRDNKLKFPKIDYLSKNAPIREISWIDAINYCNWLSKKNGFKPAYKRVNNQYVCDFSSNGYRLPTEAEWEFAAKGGNETKNFKYSGSNKADIVSWYKNNSNNKIHQVGTKLANELGIYDMSGNVWEWCWDWYNKDFYLTESGNNPIGPERGTERCLRGGSWDSRLYSLRCANRLKDKPFLSSEFYGFRLARTIN